MSVEMHHKKFGS